MSDLDQHDLAARAARAATAPEFDSLVRRARARRRTAVIGSGLAVAAIAAGVVTVAALPTDDAGPAAPSPTTPPHTHLTRPSPSAPQSPTGNIPEDGPCPPTGLVTLPPYSGCASVVHGDFDGDGARDTLIIFRHPLDAAKLLTSPYHARLVPAHGTPQTITLHSIEESNTPGSNPANMRAVAVVDANRDRRADALVVLQQGAATYFLGIVSDPAGRLVQVKDRGRPFEIDVGAVVLFGSGGYCTDLTDAPLLVETGYFFRQGKWHWTKTWYRWVGARVVPAGHAAGVTTEERASAYASFHCFGLTLPEVLPPTRAR